MKIQVFNKNSEERVKEGHYKITIEGSFIDFMSVWTFKNEYKLPDNTKEQNELDSKEMNFKYGAYPYKCLIEKEDPLAVSLHPVEQMEDYYDI
ncbi:MAG: hypothetical protein CMD31_13005 [Flavobacteriales bacterium]|nr:hypothetical protein [Flavobacteriales bacterium]|tara:strand:+ start:29188 stop:29466 length:279 start_codon:yes stop_codon:yes gene_type:complete